MPNHIPGDFNPDRHILLFQEMPSRKGDGSGSPGITKKMDKALQKYCPYKYKIVTPAEILDLSKYSDTSVYKYAVLNSLRGITRTTTTTVTHASTGTSTSVSPSATTTYINYGFYDRVNKIEYGSTRTGNPFIKKAIAAFVKVIEKTIAGRSGK